MQWGNGKFDGTVKVKWDEMKLSLCDACSRLGQGL